MVSDGRQYKRLADCTVDGQISYGIVQPGKHVDSGVPVIRVNNVNNGQLDLSNVLRVDPAIEAKYSRTRLRGGEVLLTLVGSTGQSFVAPPELAGWNVPRAIAVIRADEGIGANWINICLQSRQTQHFLDVRANTTVQKTLNLKDVRDIPILIPPKEEKQFIEECWCTLSDKIELNRKMNETLEAVAQALFKSWFVDFDPVIDNILRKNKLGAPSPPGPLSQGEKGREISWDDSAIFDGIPDDLQDKAEIRREVLTAGKATTSAPAVAAAEFPDEFYETDEMGWIPKGWEVSSLAELVDLVGGGTPKTSVDEYWGGDIPWFSVVDAPSDSDVFVIDTEKHVTNLGVENSSTKILPTGTTIISARGTVGKCALVGNPMAMNQSCYGVRGKQGISDFYVYYAVRNQVGGLQRAGHGSVFNTITRDTFRITRTAFGGADLSQTFQKQIHPQMDRVLANLKMNAT